MRRVANNKSLRGRVKEEKRTSVKRERTDDDVDDDNGDYDGDKQDKYNNYSSANDDNDFFDV